MLSPTKFVTTLEAKPRWLLDGAVGTELERRGYHTSLPFWTAFAALDHPDLLSSIHGDYIKAGADIISANTFRISRYVFEREGRHMDFHAVLKATIDAAKSALGSSTNILLAASLATLEDCYRPDLVPDLATLSKYHRAQLETLAQFDFDFILAETINTSREAEVICAICQEMDLALMISFVSDGSGKLLSGEDLDPVLDKIVSHNPGVVSLNCGPAASLIQDAQILLKKVSGAKGLYPNGGELLPNSASWNRTKNVEKTLADFTQTVKQWDIKIIGGCCGTTPTLLNSIAQKLRH